MATVWLRRLARVCAILVACAACLSASAAQTDCLECHRALVGRKVVHAAVYMGCSACHAESDTTVVPHKVRERLDRVSAVPPPSLCERCHDSESFNGEFTHAPAAAGLCLSCHDPHGAEYAGLLRKMGAALCLDCHSEIKDSPHLLAGFSQTGHPLGNEIKPSMAQDPLRPGKPFYCASCHEPHSANRARLNRFDTNSMATFCEKCHRL